jgi:hypothetical protein
MFGCRVSLGVFIMALATLSTPWRTYSAPFILNSSFLRKLFNFFFVVWESGALWCRSCAPSLKLKERQNRYHPDQFYIEASAPLQVGS